MGIFSIIFYIFVMCLKCFITKNKLIKQKTKKWDNEEIASLMKEHRLWSTIGLFWTPTSPLSNHVTLAKWPHHRLYTINKGINSTHVYPLHVIPGENTLQSIWPMVNLLSVIQHADLSERPMLSLTTGPMYMLMPCTLPHSTHLTL